MDTSVSLLADTLSVCDIPQESVTELWETNFLNSCVTLSPTHSAYQPEAWQEFADFCLSCRESAVGVWNTLMRAGVPHESITAAVHLSLSAEGPSVLGLSACLGYVCILSVEGANIYKLFHPAVFHRSVGLLCSSHSVKKTHRNANVVTQEEDLDMDLECADKNTMDGGMLARVLKEMISLLKNFRFQLHLDSLQHLISSLFSVVRRHPLETDPGGVNFLAWSCIGEVHRPLHGEEKEILCEVLQHLLPLLTLKGTESKNSSSVSRPQQKLCEQSISYLHYLLDKGLMGREARVAFVVVPRHLCQRCPVLSNYKTRGAKVVRELVSCLSGEDFSAFFRWFSSLLNSRRHEHRNMAVSVALEFITASDSDCEVSLSAESEHTSNLCKFLLECLMQRCSDSVSPVRANALQALADLSSNASLPHMQEYIRSLASAPGSDGALLGMLSRRLSDQKASVRKSGLVALEGVLRLLPCDVMQECMGLIRERCFDVSLSVRKQSVVSLKELLLACPDSRPVRALFLSGLLPLVLDPETSVQERSVEVLVDELFSQLTPYRAARPCLSWSLLSHLCGEEGCEYQKYFLHFLQRLTQGNKLTKQLIRKLTTYTDSPDCLDAWRLLVLVSEQTEALEVSQVFAAWNTATADPDACRQEIDCMIRILSNLHKKLSVPQTDKLQVWLSGELEKCIMDSAHINRYVNALIVLSQQPSSERGLWFSAWTAEMVRKSSLFVKDWLHHKSSPSEGEDLSSEDRFITQLCLLGELVTVSPDRIDPDIPPLVQWALIQRRSLDADTSTASTHSFVPHLSPRLRAFICILFGKLCLVRQELAYDSPDLLSAELFSSDNVPLKNNIIIVLCDLCVRFPNLIENYLSYVSPCLRDGSYLVRRQTLVLLTKLIQEDYIKLRGALIYHLLAVLNDPELRGLVEYCLKHVVLKKYPRAFYHHFIESVFYFQHNCNHPNINQFPQTQMETDRFSLPGPHNTKKRFAVYNYMLHQLSDEQRFNLSARIVQEILAPTLDRVLLLNPTNCQVITDALSILCSDNIKLSCVKTHSVDTLEDDEREAMEAAVSLQSDVIKTLVKKDAIENIIPTIIGLKRLFQKERSPLLSSLMCYLYRLKDDYKEKFSEVLSADKQLAEEIEFDIKRYEDDMNQVRRSINMRASLTAADVALANPNFSPAVLLSPRSVSVAKALRDVGKPSRVENTPCVLRLQRLNVIKTESRRKVTSPLSISHKSPIPAEGDGSPELRRNTQRRKKAEHTAQAKPADDTTSFKKPKDKPPRVRVSLHQSPPSLEQDVLMNSFGPPVPPIINSSLSSVRGEINRSILPDKNLISFSPDDSGIGARLWNLKLRQRK